MANLAPARTFPSVYQIEVTDDIQGGAGGIANTQAQNLLNRTEYLLAFQKGASAFVDISATLGTGAGTTLSDNDSGKIIYIGNTAVPGTVGYKYVTLPQANGTSNVDISPKGNSFTFVNDSPDTFIKVFPNNTTNNDRFYMQDAYQTILTVRPYEVITIRRVVGLSAWLVVERFDMIPSLEAGQLTAQPIQPRRSVLCDGRAVSRLNYDRLFALIGTTYGTGNGSTTFNVPNMSVNSYYMSSIPNPFNYYIYF